MTKILLADDHALLRAGIRSILKSVSGVEVVAEAEDGREALKLIKAHRPDIVLMDISMPGLNGLETIGHVKKEFPLVRVIVLSMHSSEEYVLQALNAGAVGYLLKDSATAELELAIRSVAEKRVYLSPSISQHVIDAFKGGAKREKSPSEILTPRQRETLQLIAEGLSTKEIAAKLNVGIKTVETHRAQLMERLGVHDVAGLVRYAIRTGIISSDK